MDNKKHMHVVFKSQQHQLYRQDEHVPVVFCAPEVAESSVALL